MITDAQLRTSQAMAVTTGTQVSTNAIDLLTPNQNIGIGTGERRAYAAITTTLTGGTSIRAEFIQSANADLSSPDVLAVGPTVAEAAAVAGKVLMDINTPANTKRYVGFQFVSVGTHGAGQVWSGIVANTDRNSYPPANTGL